MKKLLLVITLLLVCSCRQGTTPPNQELLLGEWYPINDTAYTDIGLIDYNMQGYRFMEDGLCDYYPGYFEYADPDSGLLLTYPYRNRLYRGGRPYWLDNAVRANGNRTNYQINEDTLSLFNLSTKVWDLRMIRFLSPDTLLLSSLDSTLNEIYIRKNYLLDDQPLFDQLVFYYPGAYFSGSYYFSIHRDGTFAYSGYCTGRNGIYTGKLKEETIEQIEALFKKANLPQMITKADSLYEKRGYEYRGSYLSMLPPSPDSYVTFISNKWFFTMTDPIREVSFDNKAFFWAYFYGLFLPQTAQFEPGTLGYLKRYFPYFEEFHTEILTKQDSIVDLFHTEKFYLNVLLIQADTTDADFEPIYTLKESYSSKKSMQTDGRYFSYINEDGEKITLDIGFNYIYNNGIDSLLRKKSPYERDLENNKKIVDSP